MMVTQDNYTRLIQLANETFGMREDPSQIIVNKKVRNRLLKIHTSTLSERRTKKGPIAWVLIFPTTISLMELFIEKKITEKELLEKTPIGIEYDAIYLCSALVLPEHRRKGIAKKLMCKAVCSIKKQHPIKYLFYWEFSKAGRGLANSISRTFNIPLLKRAKK